MKIVVFDTETSGLPSERNPSIYETQKWPYILQLSFIIYDNEKNEIEKEVNDIQNKIIELNLNSNIINTLLSVPMLFLMVAQSHNTTWFVIVS